MEKNIEIQGLTKSFGTKEVLKNIDLTLYEGKNIVILGKSGSGKSVLTKCIVGLIIPDAGTIKLFGKSIYDFEEDEMDLVRTKIGYLFQGGAIYDSMSVRENIEFPLKKTQAVKTKNDRKLNELILETLENVGLKDAVNKKPSELSGGMRKRLGLARTLVLKPKVILYDEPTTGLDPVTSGEISELITKIQRKFNTASIIITHDMKCVKMTADHIKMLKDGNFFAEGSYNDLSKSTEPEIQAYFN